MSESKQTGIGLVGADTSLLVDFFQGDIGAVTFMRHHAGMLRISELVIYEFLCGNLTTKQQNIFFSGIQSFATVSCNREAVICASELFRSAKKNGTTVGHQDCLIAGSYLAHGVTFIATRNHKHFSSLPQIRTLSY